MVEPGAPRLGAPDEMKEIPIICAGLYGGGESMVANGSRLIHRAEGDSHHPIRSESYAGETKMAQTPHLKFQVSPTKQPELCSREPNSMA